MNRQSHGTGGQPRTGTVMVESPAHAEGLRGSRSLGALPSHQWSPTPAVPAEGGCVGFVDSQGTPSAGARVTPGGGEAWIRRRPRPKRTAPYRHVPHREKAPTAVARRNARERRRVEAVNGAFLRLRRAVPPEVLSSGGSVERGKRVSKVKTLHRAIEYITQLQGVLRDAGCHITLGNYASKLDSQEHTGERESMINGQSDVIRWRGVYENGYRDSEIVYPCGILQPYRGEF
ncbi:uncharacterized protein LOC124162231 [Ischnura elegans]|uniref:uncharacterized protein LOC124162231 n=1 Tax=Ischnura elegans TaxID=197161 RepID=UPI001ED8BD0C|nr:uncharacterized protein LOC124162231 [Ischnura elegans]XP_046394648.1 uncharacterized protein LOC124162231 [Ischnura elegans]